MESHLVNSSLKRVNIELIALERDISREYMHDEIEEVDLDIVIASADLRYTTLLVIDGSG